MRVNKNNNNSFIPKKSIHDLPSLKGKKVLVRVDFNVPIKNGIIQNDYRIRSALPTIVAILQQGGSAIVMSHLGRPKSDVTYYANDDQDQDQQKRTFYEETSSLAPVATRLQDLVAQEAKKNTKIDPKDVLFAKDCLDAQEQVDRLERGQILLLENLRFYKNESSKKEEERLAMAAVLVEYADSYYVSDAFGTAHRDSASMTGVPKLMSTGSSNSSNSGGVAVAGYLMNKEIEAFGKVLADKGAPRPFVAIVGGAKVSDKILLLEHLMNKVDKLMIGGAMAYTFLKAQGHSIGRSMSEDGETLDLALQLVEKANERGVELILPIDHLCHTEFKNTDAPFVTDGVDIPNDYMALDIGPRTREAYVEILSSSCEAVIWNGPMGVFELPAFSKGTFALAKAMADNTQSRGMTSIVGGGDSASAAEQSGHAVRMTHVSTGGGASLELLEGKTLPGIASLQDAISKSPQ
eukprot:CAMPEP_0118716568 /NCGR_PEP_ID=MMETSP0800-20121206/27572_1 /TAXON_ID=210618 ORGANISM="Striatella unipunctata, Strain CCMP2910" /NCGR_SAMPLE_ID=MMETSP0800 /ASSEMBLY_ACC=CAM_ASM_000638 /LENGTH=463 /DNA_ID=CAMNT_0006623001 /DNA_START=198 /DNA_END=1589 /DNA_ORIENTATION=+